MNKKIQHIYFLFLLIISGLFTMSALYSDIADESKVIGAEIKKNNDGKIILKKSHINGKTNEKIMISFASESETETDYVNLNIPLSSRILLNQISDDISLIKTDKADHWIMKSNNKKASFELPLEFNEIGKYTITIGNEKLTIEINDSLEKKQDVNNFFSNPIQEGSEITENRNINDYILNENITEKNKDNEDNAGSRLVSAVGTWEQFQEALNDTSVTNITLTDNISGNTPLNIINRDISINGNGYTINSQSQQFIIMGSNRTFEVRNTILLNSLRVDAPQFRTTSGALNTTFIFSDITVDSDNRFVGRAGSTGNEDPNIKVIFNGGKNIFRSISRNTQPLTVVRNIVLNNQALVESNNRQFSASLIGDNDVGRMSEMTIEEGSKLNINLVSGVGLVTTGLSVNGDLEIRTTGAAIVTQGNMDYLHFGENSKSLLIQEGDAGFVFASNSDKLRIDIDLGASFDFMNIPGKPILYSTTSDLLTNVEIENLAVWKVGRRNVESSTPSQNFIDLIADMQGANSSEIRATNNNVFRSTYSHQGLAGYSRINTDGVSTNNPVDPLDPGEEINPDDRPLIPENQGDLRVDFISQFRFGLQYISGNDKIYYANEQIVAESTNNSVNSDIRPNYVQITDNRSSDDGWQLTVTQTGQLKTDKGRELFGATLGFTNQEVLASHDGEGPNIINEEINLIPENSEIVLTAQKNKGKGTWIYRFGDIDSANSSVFLSVPKGATPEATNYKTTLNWELNAVPENEWK